jgi:3'(2'), 5'-bisphosphate nucleotidase
MFTRELSELRSLLRAAGGLIMDVYGTDFGVELKTKSDPVTEADKRANEYLVERLRALFPGDGIVAEETADQSEALNAKRCWFIDPLDGTKEFIARNGEFSVMVGLAVDGRAQVGAVFQPVTDKLYLGAVGGGATLEQHGVTRALSVSDVADPSALKLVVSRSHRDKSLDGLVQALGITSETPSGSVGLKVGHIAERNADLYVHVSNKSSRRDACGPEAILKAAGGVFTDLSGQAFDYRVSAMQNARGILACNHAAFDKVLPVAQRLGREAGLV